MSTFRFAVGSFKLGERVTSGTHAETVTFILIEMSKNGHGREYCRSENLLQYIPSSRPRCQQRYSGSMTLTVPTPSVSALSPERRFYLSL